MHLGGKHSVYNKNIAVIPGRSWMRVLAVEMGWKRSESRYILQVEPGIFCFSG